MRRKDDRWGGKTWEVKEERKRRASWEKKINGVQKIREVGGKLENQGVGEVEGKTHTVSNRNEKSEKDIKRAKTVKKKFFKNEKIRKRGRNGRTKVEDEKRSWEKKEDLQ